MSGKSERPLMVLTMSKNKKTGCGHRRPITHPWPHEVTRVFTPIEIVFDELKQGMINEADGRLVFYDPNERMWFDVIGALQGWIETWSVVLEHYGIALDQSPLTVLAEKLARDDLLTPEEVDAAHRVLIAQKRLYMFRIDVYLMKGVVNHMRSKFKREEQHEPAA